MEKQKLLGWATLFDLWLSFQASVSLAALDEGMLHCLTKTSLPFASLTANAATHWPRWYCPFRSYGLCEATAI